MKRRGIDIFSEGQRKGEAESFYRINVTPVPISLAGFSCSGFPEKIIRKL
jgi:hypothetical protein